MAQVSPEIRFRIGRDERAQFEQVAERLGMDANDMVKVFIRRAIAAGGFPFEMRALANDVHPPAERILPVHGVSVAHLSDIGSRAAKAAHAEHIEAGRLPPSSKRGPRGVSR
ncbi:type II toxin-antitoxin system RelB/DinJ family antitoxin [Piscinibacter sp.]|uniref:type II toxin-antitoxin system RelB/DinJ family antitoxin n=1 Tax=Piscinibacter sp. TaxID=1903157 RepID=UPI002BB27475|nr:type II toxin-antitoxin system RelB/DinJ family antitoxin [Albitalea sp.]HUG25664.1 type II toxin-antitoxin system RelB/DinJ family antitoxin [Albitalea sp.]